MKSMTLGAGYGCGAEKFRAKCAEIGISMSPEEAKRRIDLYRQRNPLVVALWKKFDYQLTTRLRHQNAVLSLPSGRALHYPDLRRRREPDTIRVTPDGRTTIVRGREGIAATLPSDKGVRLTYGVALSQKISSSKS